MKEIWKKVDGFNNFIVSNTGKLYNIKTKRYLKAKPTKDGYIHSTLNERPKKLVTTLHKLVALSYVPNPKENEYNEINHKDGNKLNNNASNLEWCTHKQNMKHALDNGLIKKPMNVSKGKDHWAPIMKKRNEYLEKENIQLKNEILELKKKLDYL